jgi:5-formyltetrahydrofolate cyclo-ligase
MDECSRQPAPLPDALDRAAQKAQLRQSLLTRRASIDQEARAHAEAIIASCLLDFCRKTRKNPDQTVIAGYWPIRDELDPRPALFRLEQAGFILALPAIDGQNLNFRRYRSRDLLVKGRFGTSEPGPDQASLIPDILLVPLVGFDRHCHRLGYGAGFYDRALAGFGDEKPMTVGLAFEGQYLPELPVETHDQPLDYVLSEGDLRRRTV